MQTKIKTIFKIISICIILSIIGHAYLIYQRINSGIVQVSTFDQTSQMLQFKNYLYQQFSQGNFFYDFNGNMGGDFFTRLSYYFSTSLIYYVTMLVTFIMDSLGIITVNLTYWAESILVISIFRSAIIIFVTQKYFRHFIKSNYIAYVSAMFYAFTIIYFRHIAAWEFFSDAMIWLPIIFLGVEKIITGQGGRIFCLGIALTLFNNAYFAYINFLLTIFYIIMRWIFHITPNEVSIKNQLLDYIKYGFFGFLISMPGFLTFTYGFKETIRPNIIQFKFDFGNLNVDYLNNLLFHSDIFVIPILGLFMLFLFKFYKIPAFRMAAISSWILIIISFIPFVGSIFNGFSDPQYRWNYGSHLFIALMIAIGLQEIATLSTNLKHMKPHMFASLGIMSILYVNGLFLFKSFENKWILFILALISSIFVITICFLSFTTLNWKKIALFSLIVLHLISIIPNLLFLRSHHGLHQASYFNHLDDPQFEVNIALNQIKKEQHEFERLDIYKQGINFPRNSIMNHHLNSAYLYSSFQNRSQQIFEDYFQIDPYTSRNTGEVLGPNGRGILMSLLNINYLIKSKHESNEIIPISFQKHTTLGNIEIYKNQYPFPFIHPVHHIYRNNDVSKMAFKDIDVIDGAFIDYQNTDIKFDNYQSSNQQVNFELKIENAHYYNSILTPSIKDVPIIITIDVLSPISNSDSLNMNYYLKPINHGYSSYKINGISKTLVSEDILYGSKQYYHQIEMKLNNKQQIILEIEPNNQFEFNLNQLNYYPINQLSQASNRLKSLDYSTSKSNEGLNIQFNNQDQYKFMVLPLFNSPGLKIYNHGKPIKIYDSNFGLVGFKIEEGQNNIQVKYQQPLFIPSCILSFISILMAFVKKPFHIKK